MVKNGLEQRFLIKGDFRGGRPPVRILSIDRRPGLGPGPRLFSYSFYSYSFIKLIFVEVGPSQNTWNLSQARPWPGPKAIFIQLLFSHAWPWARSKAILIRCIWVQGTTYLPVTLAVLKGLF